MCVVTSLVSKLKAEYNNVIDFKRICTDYNIGVTLADLGDGENGHTTFTDTHAVIALNKNLSQKERDDWRWHELFHAIRKTTSNSVKEEARATLFAGLIVAPVIYSGDTIFTLADRYNTSYRIAKSRIDFELKQLSLYSTVISQDM